MSTLVSSAVGAKKVAAPKSAARRRQPPAPSLPAAKAVTPTPETGLDARASTPVAAASSPAVASPASPALRSHPPPHSPAQSTQSNPLHIRSSPIVPAQVLQGTRSPSLAREPAVQSTENEQSASTRKRQQAAAPTEDSSRPTKRAKRSSNRSNATGQASAVDEVPDAPLTTGEAEGRRTRSKKQNDAAAKDWPSSNSAAKPKRQAKLKPKSAPTVQDDDDDDGSAVPNEVPTQPADFAQTAPVKKGRQRKKAPVAQEAPVESAEQEQEQDDEAVDREGEAAEGDDSDPELHEIDPNTVTMWEVGGDKRHGKTSEREKKMAEIDWTEVARKRREAAERMLVSTTTPALAGENVVESIEGVGGSVGSREKQGSQPAASTAKPNIGGVQFRIVNGQIVEDESSLTVDRQAQAETEAEQNNGPPIEEEADLTTRINRTTYLNDRRRDVADRLPAWKSKSDAWNDEDTDRFYEALKMFGTDFFIISKMFPPKTRRQIKTKFVREERLDPRRINAALLGQQTKPMDLEHYAREVGQDVSEFTKYEGVKDAEDAIRLSLADREEEMRNAIREEERIEEAKRKEQQERENARKRGQMKKAKAGGGGGGGGGRQKKKKGGEDGATSAGGESSRKTVAGVDG